VRVPDQDIGYIAFGWLTMGQILSLPVLAAGLTMLAWAYTRRETSGNHA
jgi:phosphatidylglycerol:prolipoprotein diacylglycerol transferase